MPIGNVVIGQSGGPTAVINQTLVGVVRTLLDSKQTGKIYGSIHGIQGVLDGKLMDFSSETAENLELVAGTPSSALLSVRLKANPETCAKIFERFQKLNISHFFYIGGNDTAETANIINEMAQKQGHPLSCFHCPKTIDNDLRVTDHCPGYGSAAKFVAQAFMGDNLDNRSLAGIKVNVVMGRDAGWLTAASSLARVFPDDGPHLIYCPEVDFHIEKFCKDVEAIYRRLGRCVIAVSEGIHGPNHSPVIDLGEKDSHGNRQLSGSGAMGDFLVETLKKHLGKTWPEKKHRLRADTFGYLQRCFPGVVSAVDAAEARMAGVAAAKAALAGVQSGSISFKRLPGSYAIETFVTPLVSVAKETKPLPIDWISAEGNDIVTAKYLPYALPLVGPLPAVGQLNLKPVQL